MARPKKAQKELYSVEECTAAMGELARVQARIAKLVAERNLAVAQATADSEPEIDAEKKVAAELEVELCVYYFLHMAELEQDGKHSVDLPTGTMGRRLGNPKLTLLNGSWTWEMAARKLQELFVDVYMRIAEPEVDRDAVKQHLVP